MTARAVLLLVLALIVGITWVFAIVSKRFEKVLSGVAELGPRSFESLTVITVGTGGTFENQWRLGPSTAVAKGDEVLLVDAGRGIAGALRAAEIPVHQPNTVLLTSLIPENTMGLDDLILTGWIAARTEPLRVMGPPGTRAALEALLRAHRSGIEATAAEWGTHRENAEVQVVELEDGAEFQVAELAVRVAALQGGSFPALAYRIEADSRSVVLASVGFAPESLVAFASGADLLVHEAVYGASLAAALEGLEADRADVLRQEAEIHPRLETIGELAREMGVKTLVLTRLRPPPVYDFQYESIVREDFDGRVVIADDGDEITP
jgi:ribonuclease BN (tRNA processing enzyme)